MHCRNCGYALWNLSRPQCPECGTAFDLRSYRFTPGSVAFACPRCDALHAGTGESFVPATSDYATCNACHQQMAVRDMRVVPLTDDALAHSGLVPWDDRKSLGLLRAYWRTLCMSMAAPAPLARDLLPQSSYLNSYGFASITYALAALAQLLTLIIGLGIAALVIALSANHASQPAQANAFPVGPWQIYGDFALGFGLPVAVIAVVQIFLAPLFAFLFLTLPAHLFLVLFEPKRQSLRYTARAVNYAQGPMILLGIPVCGWYCSSLISIWPLIASIFMIAATHRMHAGKATLAVWWFPGTVIVLFFLANILVTVGQALHWF